VIQAAGRVIRTTSDKGYLWLLDDRYADDAIKSLLPKWWMNL
jgi:DNA excision repair protein ERCC-2